MSRFLNRKPAWPYLLHGIRPWQNMSDNLGNKVLNEKSITRNNTIYSSYMAYQSQYIVCMIFADRINRHSIDIQSQDGDS